MKSDYELKIKKYICLNNICHHYDILKDSCPNWNSIQDRVFSVIVYMLLKSFDLKWDYIANILGELNCINIKYAHAWCRSILDNGSINILDDQRGKHHHEEFMIFTPKLKFHCEYSPSEGFWCFSKDHVRKYNDQNYETMKRLINEAFAIYKD
jgi:hypothetical protein